MKKPDALAGVSIAEAMTSLREQVLKASELAQTESLRFSVREIEVEFQLELTTTVQGSASVKIWQVVTVGAEGSRAAANTHRVRLVLEPRRSRADRPGRAGSVLLGDSGEQDGDDLDSVQEEDETQSEG
jgi:Trypsin-co-occurring domain 2